MVRGATFRREKLLRWRFQCFVGESDSTFAEPLWLKREAYLFFVAVPANGYRRVVGHACAASAIDHVV